MASRKVNIKRYWTNKMEAVPFVAISQRHDPWQWITNTSKDFDIFPRKRNVSTSVELLALLAIGLCCLGAFAYRKLRN
jgi:hypothetical protein